jgi:toxin CcdB
MPYLDVYPNRDARTATSRPYVIDLQSWLLDDLPSTIIAPLAIPESIDSKRILRLNPDLLVNGMTLVLLAQDLAAIPRPALRYPVTNLSLQREEILAALDFLFTGF